jgi:hypothetical protein
MDALTAQSIAMVFGILTGFNIHIIYEEWRYGSIIRVIKMKLRYPRQITPQELEEYYAGIKPLHYEGRKKP